MKRREFLSATGGVVAASAACSSSAVRSAPGEDSADQQRSSAITERLHDFNGSYQGECLNQIAFPLGGMGAGMVCLEGTGALSKISLRHRPELETEHRVFAAVSIQGQRTPARVLEGPIPAWKLRPQFANLGATNTWGLPRFHEAAFTARFPFATVELKDDDVPVGVTLTAWSPFSPGDADNASLPVAGLEYTFTNAGATSVAAVFSFNAENFLAESGQDFMAPNSRSLDRIRPLPGGFMLYAAGAQDHPWDQGSCAVWVDEDAATVNHAWYLDSLEVLWREISEGQHRAREPRVDAPAAGASIFVPFKLRVGAAKTITVRWAWYVPRSNLYEPTNGYGRKIISYPRPPESYQPWYAGRFSSIEEVVTYWDRNYPSLREAAQRFCRTFYDSTLSPEVVEAVAANLCTLKSPTVLRQPDGRLWGWEGTTMWAERTGVSGTTTHVWSYAQSIPHLFPALERGMRETEFELNQDTDGLQYCRTPLPIRPVEPGHTFPDGPAADGQLSGIIKTYRDWRISGDAAWLRRLWSRIRASLDYCIKTWDPGRRGWIEEPHVNTYDVEFWGPDSMCTSLYLGALKAATLMGSALKEPVDAYAQLLHRGVQRMEQQLFNGEYFQQRVQWTGLRTAFPPKDYFWIPDTTDWSGFASREGPPYQCGSACMSDGLLGVWLCFVSGIDSVIDPLTVESHLDSVHRHNLMADLTDHPNLMRAVFACGNEAGLVVGTWPRGGRPRLAMTYVDEVFTGIEYQTASHLIALGKVDAGLEIVRAARRRYDGRVRNPFAEVEAGFWYARAMSSYALLQALSGARYDAVDRTLHLKPAIKGDFRCFLSTATGYGTVGVENGKPFLEVVSGEIPYTKIQYRSAT